MDKMIAYCGLVCTECPAYIATKANDAAAIERVARLWAKEYNAQITAAAVWCDGCLSAGPRLCSHCGECEIRACAISRGVVNCAYCDDYGCQTISGFLAHVPDAKAVLENIRATL
ncbi:MAG: DUF3795 domain-containing protein [Chloroflexi bacterium]|nr:DUF3795 domain-containing protein [Chloroflexota bacterium]